MINKYFVEFIIFSFLGWVWETIYCTICNKKWENRGFLFGTVCPIYGVGSIAAFIMLDIIKLNNLPALTWWQIFLIGLLGSAVLEYSTSLLLEKLFHAYWWDYSNMPFNINGRICVPASIGFALVGLLIVFVIYPFFEYVSTLIMPIFIDIAAFIFLILFTVDMTLTISSLTDIQRKIEAIDDNINLHMGDIVENIYVNSTNLSKKAIARISGVRFKKSTHTTLYKKLIEKIQKHNIK
ncbi:MAG: putative ABC transporter permease [Clostridia bacterium]|nr:putative ABC transporter permease [Clostridia bacterium]